jgi:hypothetical protein
MVNNIPKIKNKLEGCFYLLLTARLQAEDFGELELFEKSELGKIFNDFIDLIINRHKMVYHEHPF